MILKFLLAFVVFVFSGLVGDDNKTLMWSLKIIGFLINCFNLLLEQA